MADQHATGYPAHDSILHRAVEKADGRYHKGVVMMRLRPDLLVFVFVAVVYALCGEAAPASLGAAEILVGAGLFYLAGYYVVATVPRKGETIEIWRGAGLIFAVYGVFCGLINAILYGNHVALIIRDIVPFLFMFLPVFLYGWVRRLDIQQKKIVTAAIVFIGLCFAARVLALLAVDETEFIGGGNVLWGMLSARSPTLLANAPTVLFTAVLLIGLGGYYLVYMRKMSDFFKAALCIALAVLPVLAMAVIQQRASMGYMLAAVIMLAVYGVWRFPYRMAVPLVLVVIAGVAAFPFLAELWQVLEHKHAAVGLNMRGREATAVMDILDGSVWTVLFGKGWGAMVQSAATGGVAVNFTHSLVTAIWLKTGLVGVVLAVFYLGALALRLYKAGRVYIIIMIAIAGPFVIDVFLYASYKSLDFGLLLLLIPLWADASPRVEKMQLV